MKNAVLIYDSTCPLCKVYTKAFVKFNMLNKEGRVSFTELEEQKFIKIVDWDRARNEIPLIDEKEEKVHYGVDALLQILGAKWNFFRWFAKQAVLVFLAKKLYKFVSYNRRIIIPAEHAVCKYDAAPDFNLKYRVFYLLFAWMLTSLTLTAYSGLLTQFIGSTSLGREFLICGGQIVFQMLLLFAAKKNKESIMEYLGTMMTVSMIGSLLLLPVLLIGSLFTSFAPIIFLAWFMLVVCVMLYDHVRRVKLTQSPKWLSVSWIVYRVLVLLVIMLLK
jgi:predicted DCC family thiol-disulfide oxidoreductase YuxK